MPPEPADREEIPRRRAVVLGTAIALFVGAVYVATLAPTALPYGTPYHPDAPTPQPAGPAPAPRRPAVPPPLHPRLADATGGGPGARRRPPDRLPDLHDADPPLHVPALRGRCLSRQPRERGLRGRCGGGGLRGGAPDRPQGSGRRRGRPGLRVLGGVLVAGRDRRGPPPARPLPGALPLAGPPRARPARRPEPSRRRLHRRSLAD